MIALAAVAVALAAAPAGALAPKSDALGSRFRALASATSSNRSELRIAYAEELLRSHRAEEARGVLAVAVADDGTLRDEHRFVRLMARALAEAGRPDEALRLLSVNQVQGECALRLRAAIAAGQPGDGAAWVNCALQEAQGSPQTRLPTLTAAAEVYLETGRPAAALAALRTETQLDAKGLIVAARAQEALGASQRAVRALRSAAKVARGPSLVEAEARLARLERRMGILTAPAAYERLDRLRFLWRGTTAEALLLRTLYEAARDAGLQREALAAGAMLMRHHAIGVDEAILAAELRATLTRLVAPQGGVAITQAADLFWENRDITPRGADGDTLARTLARRLANVGLLQKAAEILIHQAGHHDDPVAAAVLGMQAAAWLVIDDEAGAALQAIEATSAPDLPEEVRSRRRQVEIAALIAADKKAARALLEAEPALPPLFLAEAWWRLDDDRRIVAATAAALRTAAIAPVERTTLVVRQAVALARSGRADEIPALRRAFASDLNPAGGKAVELLGVRPEALDVDAFRAALDSLPKATPAYALVSRALDCESRGMVEIACAGPLSASVASVAPANRRPA